MKKSAKHTSVKLPKKYEKEKNHHDRVEEAEEMKHEKRHDKEEKRLLKKLRKNKVRGK